MRIRKQASKLLGWAAASSPPSPDFLSFPASQSWPPPPPSPVKDVFGEFQCQLNLSPWDAIDGSHHCMNFQQDLTAIAAIGCGFEGKEEQFTGSSASEIAEPEVEERTAGVKKETKKMKRRGTEEVVAAAEGLDDFDRASPVKYCKKTDGKRWRCKRPAQLPHSLCGYHRTQHRSYASHRRREEASLGSKKNPANGGSAASDSYYYYSVFGPWWSKRRGSPSEGGVGSESSDQFCVSAAAAAESDGERKKVTGQVGSKGNGEEEKEEGDGGSCCKYMQLAGGRLRAKKTAKKRGRKRMKARSLKSLF